MPPKPADDEDDLVRLNRILTKLGLDRIFPDELSDRIYRIVLSPWLGVALLMAILFVVFQAVFAWSALPMEWIEAGFTFLGELCATYLPDGFIKDLLVDAVIGGVGGVVVFLPQILILFFFILVMEESGYLPRAAFLLDRTMGSVGLSGRSFLPLLSGYACAVPAIMAARIVGNQRDRWATIAIAPLLTCGARLPVYAVMIAAFVPDISVAGIGLQGLVLFALYCLGMVGALVVAWILKHTTGKGENRTLMLELPSYHVPRIDALVRGLAERAWIYLEKVGTIILALTIVLWILTTFPGAPEGATGPAINYSFAGMMGRAMEPLFAPIGFNWQMCVSLIPAMGAREVAVAVLGTLYATGSEAEAALVPILQHSWTIPMGLSFLVRPALRLWLPLKRKWAPGRPPPFCGWLICFSHMPFRLWSITRHFGCVVKPIDIANSRHYSVVRYRWCLFCYWSIVFDYGAKHYAVRSCLEVWLKSGRCFLCFKSAFFGTPSSPFGCLTLSEHSHH